MLRAVATDGHRLARVELPLPDGADGMPGVIVPRKTVQEVRRLLDEVEGTVSVALSDVKIRFDLGDCVLTSKLIDGTFPDYDRVIPVANDKLLEVPCKLFAEAVDRVSTISTEKSRAVKLSLDSGTLVLSATSPENGTASEEIEVGYASAPIEIGFNSKYLLDITASRSRAKARSGRPGRRGIADHPAAIRGDLRRSTCSCRCGCDRTQEVTRRSISPGPGPDGPRVAVLRLDLTRFRSYREVRVETDGRPVVWPVRTAPARPISWRRSRSWPRGAACAGRAWPRSTSAARRRGGPLGGRGPAGDAVRRSRHRHRARSHGGLTDRRVVRIDGQAAKGQAALARCLNLVWLTPQMDRLFQEGAAPRRRFLDRLVFGFDPEHAHRVASYDQALRTRSKLLREGSRDAGWLGLLEETMAREGVAVAASRRDIVRALDAAAAEGEAFPVPRIGLDGEAEAWLADMPALDAEERLRAGIRRRTAARRRDRRHLGRPAPGRSDRPPCRHGQGGDRVFDRRAEGPADRERAGPCAAAGGAARRRPGAAARRGRGPSRPDRRAALFERLLDLGGQAWLTGTDPELFEELGPNAHFLTVAEGRVVPARDRPGLKLRREVQ